jgi:nucleoside-diphosphate-sugar epimerase
VGLVLAVVEKVTVLAHHPAILVRIGWTREKEQEVQVHIGLTSLVMKVVVFGATGVVGFSAARHFATLENTSVVGVSRRPTSLAGVEDVPLDLSDRTKSSSVLGSDLLSGTTHVVYAALQEGDNLVAGWRDRDLMDHNLLLFKNAVEPLVTAQAASLRHMTLLQGAKVYGLHVGRSPLPAKERSARDDHDNFYFLQEDVLRSLARDADWSWTILRPQVVYGQSLGSPMNLLPVIGVYAAVERARGRPLCFPGGPPAAQEAVDARLLARALGWAAASPYARNETFNVTNGDVFCWRDVWPTIADMFGMEVGEPEPLRLADAMPARSDEWAHIVDRYQLAAPRDMTTFVGGSWTYADILFGSTGTRPLPALLSTVKIRQAGFDDCIDTEDMFRELIGDMQSRRLLPGPT